MKLLQINVTANWGSTGKIAEDIGKIAIQQGWESWIAYGRGNPESASNLIRVGSDLDLKSHVIQTRLFDNHGLVSSSATRKFINQIREINPDIIHLHNIHGYFLNYPKLFSFLKEYGKPVVWTLHDCWPFTGHCAYYDFVKCGKWKNGCFNCPQLGSYPQSILLDRSEKNYRDKKKAFLGVENLTLVPVSNWLRCEVGQSFLKDYPVQTIHNGIDINVFKASKERVDSRKVFKILGVASVWDRRKGLEEFIKLRSILPEEYEITLVGLSKKQIEQLPDGIGGITRTDSIEALVDLYSSADVFVNPTLEDNFPTTNLESLACGTPVITYDTGGSPEAVDSSCGIVVPYQDVQGLASAIVRVCGNKAFTSEACRKRAEEYFDKNKSFQKYLDLYSSLLRSDN